MHVLFVSARFPFPPRSGADMRIYQLLRQMAARHEVTLLGLALAGQQEGVAALREEFAVETVERRERTRTARRWLQLRSIASPLPFYISDVHSDAMQAAVNDICRVKPIDLIQLEGSILCSLAIPRGVSVILDEHNVEYEISRRMCEAEATITRRLFHRWEYERFRRFEERSWNQVDGCALTSSREDLIVRAAAPQTPTAVVPNGVDLEYFAPSHTPFEPHTLVFNGKLDYRPNLDAAHHLVEEIWPLVLSECPDARLTIVGGAETADVRSLDRDRVTLTGEVADIRPYLQRAAVVTVPVRIGSGTRLKVVEGLAMGKAMVSTSLGCEGIDVVEGEHLLIGDDAAGFAARVLELFEQPVLGEALGAAGRRLVEREYSWDLAGERLAELYERATAERRFRTVSSPTRSPEYDPA